MNERLKSIAFSVTVAVPPPPIPAASARPRPRRPDRVRARPGPPARYTNERVLYRMRRYFILLWLSLS